MHARQKRRQYEDEGDEIIPDGGHVHVPLHLADAMQRNVATHYAPKACVVDALAEELERRRKQRANVPTAVADGTGAECSFILIACPPMARTLPMT